MLNIFIWIFMDILFISLSCLSFQASVSPVAENIFSVEYQPKVLDCFYSNTVRHFFPSTWEEIFSYSHTLDFRLKQKFSANTTGNNVMPKPIYFTKQSKPTINQISDEDIQNMAAFCFPGKFIFLPIFFFSDYELLPHLKKETVHEIFVWIFDEEICSLNLWWIPEI